MTQEGRAIPRNKLAALFFYDSGIFGSVGPRGLLSLATSRQPFRFPEPASPYLTATLSRTGLVHVSLLSHARPTQTRPSLERCRPHARTFTACRLKF
jgi:hypothetical protein